MRFLRTLSNRRLSLLLSAVAVLAVAGAAIAMAARGGGGPTPPAEPLANAIHDAVTAAEPDGITARIKFTNNLFPSGALTGQAGSALMSGASGRLWVTNDGRGRLELQSDAGDAQIVWSPTDVTVYDASSNTAYRLKLPADTQTQKDNGAPPTLADITDFLTKLQQQWGVSGADPTNVAGEPAYRVSVSPKHDGGLLGSAQLAWDALHGVPLRIAIYAQGGASPVLALQATDISFGKVADSDVDVSPPAGAKITDVSPPAQSGSDKQKPAVTGLDAVQAQVPFQVVAPDTLVGLPRQDVRLLESKDSPNGALVVYGQGLGAILVVEHQPDAQAQQKGMLDALPTVSLDGVTAHELSTQLGTVLSWRNGGVQFVLAGSLPSAAAESAARALK
jgi:outer membrane lipoprotein-sorting protein